LRISSVAEVEEVVESTDDMSVVIVLRITPTLPAVLIQVELLISATKR